MNEAETRAEHIDPALQGARWGVVEGCRIRREYSITPGRIAHLCGRKRAALKTLKRSLLHQAFTGQF